MIKFRRKEEPLRLVDLPSPLEVNGIRYNPPRGTRLGTEIEKAAGYYLDIPPEYDSATHQLGTVATWDEINGTVMMNVVVIPAKTPEQIASERTAAVVEIKAIRGETLDKFTKHRSGVQMVYDTNYTAATRFLAGDTTVLKTGMTPELHLAFGLRFGMDTTQFAHYIIAENIRLGPSAWDVEDQYGASLVAVQSCPADQIQGVVNAYREWYSTVSGN